MKRNGILGRYGGTIELVIYIIIPIIIWELASNTFVSEVFLPKPSTIAGQLLTDFTLNNAFSTLLIILIGFAISVTIGLIIGFLIVYYPSLQKTLYPIMFTAESVPSTGIAILLVVWIGTGWLSKLFVVIYSVFFCVVVNTVGGLTSVKYEFVEMMYSIQATRWQSFKKLRFPNALPQIVTGLKIAAPLTVLGVVVAELFAGNSGLGYQVASATSRMNTPLLFAALVWMGIIGTALYEGIIVAERLANPWYLRQKKQME